MMAARTGIDRISERDFTELESIGFEREHDDEVGVEAVARAKVTISPGPDWAGNDDDGWWYSVVAETTRGVARFNAKWRQHYEEGELRDCDGDFHSRDNAYSLDRVDVWVRPTECRLELNSVFGQTIFTYELENVTVREEVTAQ